MDYNVSFPGLGIHDLPISREFVNVFGFSIKWYGVVAALALALAMTLAFNRSKKFAWKQEDLLDYFLFLIPFSLVGARIYYCLLYTSPSPRD